MLLTTCTMHKSRGEDTASVRKIMNKERLELQMDSPHETRPLSQTKVGNYRWFICILLFAATTINYIDRQILGLLKPVLEKNFHWSETDYSRIVMAFTACYALGLLFYGRVIDKIGTKLGYIISVSVWSVAAML